MLHEKVKVKWLSVVENLSAAKMVPSPKLKKKQLSIKCVKDSIHQKNSHLKKSPAGSSGVSSEKELNSSAQRPEVEHSLWEKPVRKSSDSEELLASEERSQAHSLSIFPGLLYLGKGQLAMLG